MLKTVTLALVASTIAVPVNAVTLITVEAAGLVNTTQTVYHKHVENFDSLPVGAVTSFVGTTGVYTASGVNSVVVKAADKYGDGTGTGRYVDVSKNSLSLTLSVMPVYTYFGAYISALDGIYDISFKKGGVLVDTFDLVAYANAHLGNAYKGNPAAPFLNEDGKEKFAFFNFDVIGGYDQVVISKGKGGGLESDNHTVGYVQMVPEPAAWALMVTGFGLVGFAARRRERNVIVAS